MNNEEKCQYCGWLIYGDFTYKTSLGTPLPLVNHLKECPIQKADRAIIDKLDMINVNLQRILRKLGEK